jgi:hypothetical protein
MTGDEPLAERSGRLDTVSAWRMDRRRFLQVAGAATAAAMAGCVGAQSSQPAVAPRAVAVAAASPFATSAPELTSVADLARSLEYDVGRIFGFVSDEIRYEPYAGALRGATGTLWARAGNSADQSALLAALLTESLVPVRFASGTLDAATATSILSSAQQDAATIRAEASAALFGSGGSASGAGSAGLSSPAPDPSELITRARANQANVAQAVTTQLQDATGTIVSALTAAGISVPAIQPTMPDLEVTRHLWVQYASGPIWVDVDPCLPGNPPAHTIATATETLDQIPVELRHQIEFLITAESVSGGQLQQAVTLDRAAFADTLVGVPITFQNAKPSGLKGLGIGIADELTGTVQYVPCLTIGGDSFVVPAPLTFGAGGGIFAEPGQPGSLEGETTAQWLDVRVSSPGKDPQVARRTIFDRVGEAARATGQVELTALKPVELVDLDADTPKEYLPCRVVHSFAVLGGLPSGQYFVQDYSTNDAFSNVSVIGNACHYVREVLFLDRGVPAGARTFSDAPNVISYSIVPTAPGVTPGTDTVSIGLDVWHRSFGHVPVAGVTPTVPPAIMAGVLSHIAERLSTGDGHTLDGSATVSPPLSVGRVFEEAKSQGIAARVVRTAADATAAGYTPDVTARLSASLADGSVAIVPERTVAIDGEQRLGWWLVDPVDGRTRDELDDGRGVAATDYSLPLTTTGRAVTAFERLAYCLAKYGFAASLFLGSEANADPSGGLNTVLTIASMMAAAFAEMPGAALC